ncbi:MAG TPA: hypothetical protein VIW73_04325 [Candidatus Cybelea sp.]
MRFSRGRYIVGAAIAAMLLAGCGEARDAQDFTLLPIGAPPAGVQRIPVSPSLHAPQRLVGPAMARPR